MFLMANMIVKVLQRPNICHKLSCLIMDSNDEESLGAAASNKSTEMTVLHSEQAEVVTEVDYG